ncbi:hypothetical protein [Streptomyces sp. WMMC1477]|uniref:hypothetical protein n=1 Tax=Streptomyces sp. WMMC1477 TaxID=3015155 RepID=UPI0022B5F124|nr:hypothetical protein [Streptomyces sp. WMMC1477]MCZ7430097.1 hypothetical protein [Streptomyces sp. WMMC1477]
MISFSGQPRPTRAAASSSALIPAPPAADVHIQLHHARPGLPVHTTLEGTIAAVQNHLARTHQPTTTPRGTR